MKLAHITLSALLLLSSTLSLADSEREGRGDNRRGSDQGRPGNTIGFPAPQPTRPMPNQMVELQVNNYFQGNSQLDLLQDYYISSQLRGQRIQDITIVAATEAGQGVAQLIINGQQSEQGQTVSQNLQNYTFRVGPFSNTLGQTLRTASLNLRGRFFIQKVIFNLLQQGSDQWPQPVPTPRNEIVRQQVDQRINEEGGIELFRLFGLGMSRQGQIIKRVTITGSSARGGGMADLLVNGQMITSPQRLSEYSNTVSFDLGAGQRIGQEIRTLQVHLRGMIQISEVTIEIENKGSEQQGRLPRRFEQVINQRLYDTTGVELSRLAMIPSNLSGQIVDSVELTLRNGDMGAKVSLCQIQMGQYQRVDCVQQVFVAQGRQVIRLSLPTAARLQDISLAVRMGMVDIDSIAINFR